MIELTDEQIRDILRSIDTGLYDGIRAVIAADRAQQAERHAEELLAYEVTVGNLRAQREQAQPVAIADDCDTGCFVEILPDVNVRMGDKLYLHPAAPQAQPGHKPMTDGEKLYAMWHSSSANDLDDFLDGWRHAEAFHGITGDKP